MRARLVLVSIGAGLIATGLTLLACGTTEETPIAATTDASEDVIVEAAPVEAAVEAAPPCDTSKNLLDTIPDAAIADGASTSGLCVQCANTTCSDFVSACNKDCDCQSVASGTLDCYLKNPANATLCAAGFLGVSSRTQEIGFGLINCLRSKCAPECATGQFERDL